MRDSAERLPTGCDCGAQCDFFQTEIDDWGALGGQLQSVEISRGTTTSPMALVGHDGWPSCFVRFSILGCFP